MINSENLTNRPAFQYKNVTGKLTTEFYGKVSTKLVRAGSLLQGTLAIRKANLVQKKKIREGQKRDRFESRLESNPNVEKNKNFINRIPRPESGVGVLGWFKNFIGSVALGFFATRLLGSLPLFGGILKGVLGVASFVASTGMFLVNAVSTFINIGYKAYDATAGFLKSIGGDDVSKIFDDFTNRISTLLDVLVIATIVRGSQGGGFGPVFGMGQRGRARQRKKKFEKPDFGVKSKSKVTPRPAGAAAQAAGDRGFARSLGIDVRRGRLTKQQEKNLRTLQTQKRRRTDNIAKRKERKLRTARARADRQARQNALLATDAGRRAFELNQFLGKGGVTNDPEFKIFKRINRLDRRIEKNQIDGDTLAATRNLIERKILVKKLQGGKSIKGSGRVIAGLGKGRPIRKRMAPRRVREDDLRSDPTPRAAKPTKMSGLESLKRKQAPGKGPRIFGKPIRARALRLPFIGAVVDFGMALLEGDSVPKAASRSIFAGLGAALGVFVGGVLGAITGPAAPLVSLISAAILGSLGDAFGGFLYDAVLRGMFPEGDKAVPNKLQNIFTQIAKVSENVFRSIQRFFFGQRFLDEKDNLIPYGGFEEDRPGYNKPTQPQVQPQVQPQTPSVPTRKPPIGGKTNFSSLFDLLTSGEGGLNSVNRGNAGDTPGGAKSILGKDLTDMTLDEIFTAQNAGRVFAVGKYQIIPKTMKGFRDYLRSQGIDTSKRKFDASLQNMFGPYSITQKRAKVGRFLSGDTSVSLDTAQLELAAEYASIGVPYDMKKGSYNGKYPLRDIKKGESLYSGTGSNYAPAAHTDSIRSMLQKLRQQASYEKSDSTVIVNSSQVASNNNNTPLPIKDKTLNIASSNQSNYDPFHITYAMG